MIVDVTIPVHGLTITEATIVRWLRSCGEQVAKGEPLLEVETDKAVDTIECPAAGVLLAQLAEPGRTVALGKVVGKIGTSPEDTLVTPPQVEAPGEMQARPAASTDSSPHPPARSGSAAAVPRGSRRASPRARRAARRLGIDLGAVTPTGSGGSRIRESDVLRAAEGAGMPAASGRRRALRLATARITVQSFRDIPHFYLEREVDAENLCAFREELLGRMEGRPGARITFTDIIVKALASALREFPGVSSRWTDGGPVPQESIDIAVAADTPFGLLTPVIRAVERLSVEEVASARAALIERARTGRATSADLEGGTFALSNLGQHGPDRFQAIIIPPQSGILAAGAIRERPRAMNGRVVSRRTLILTLSADHRVMDGVEAARFLGRIVEILEDGCGEALEDGAS